MLKQTALLMSLISCCALCCGRSQGPAQVADDSLAKKYAKYRVAVHKEPGLKNWLATLEKGEDVDLLNEESVTTKSKKQLGVSKVRLAGGAEGYLESRHLADKTVIFTADTPAFIRPTPGSRPHAKIPRGTIAFVVGEQANWTRIYAGRIGGVWVTNQWVQGGYTAEQRLLTTARQYEAALGLLSSAREKERREGVVKLNEIAESGGIFAEMAREKLGDSENIEPGREPGARVEKRENAQPQDDEEEPPKG